MASAGSNNEVYIWDLTKPDTPYNPGPKSSKLDDITSVGWNGQVQHILATSSSNGHTVVWDLRNRKEVMTLSAPNTGVISGRKTISSVAWHPDVVIIKGFVYKHILSKKNNVYNRLHNWLQRPRMIQIQLLPSGIFDTPIHLRKFLQAIQRVFWMFLGADRIQIC